MRHIPDDRNNRQISQYTKEIAANITLINE
jgi:hypothetical protein